VVRNLAPVDPEAALDLIERNVMGENGREIVARDAPNRDSWMRLLRSIAYFPEYFARATRLLSRFVTAELDDGERVRNSRHLEELYYIYLSGTQATPPQRLEMIEELLAEASAVAEACAMIALDSMLKTGYFSTTHNFAFGGRAMDYGWYPRTREDFDVWYGGALRIVTRLAISRSAQRQKAREILGQHFRELWNVAPVQDPLEAAALLAVAADAHWPEGWIAACETLSFDAERMAPEHVSRLTTLIGRLAPPAADIVARIRTYVLNPAWRIADGCPGDGHDARQQAHERAVEHARMLGREVAPQPDSIGALWLELLGGSVDEGGVFGEGLGESAGDLKELWSYLIGRLATVPAEKRNVNVLCGVLHVAFQRDAETAGAFLDEAVNHDILGVFFPRLQGAVGIDGRAVQRLLDSLHLGRAPAWMYEHVCLPRNTKAIAAEDVCQLVQSLAALPGGYNVAARVLEGHLTPRQRVADDIEPALVRCGVELLKTIPLTESNDRTDHYLARIAKRCLQGAEAAEDVGALCDRLLDALGMPGVGPRGYRHLIDALVAIHSLTALDHLLTEEPKNYWHSCVFDRDSGDDNPLVRVPTETLIEWAQADPRARFPRLARAVPVVVNQDRRLVWTDSALAILAAAPERGLVFSKLTEDFYPTSWSGSIIPYYEMRRELLRSFFNDDDEQVRDSARQVDEYLQRAMENEREQERERDERFE
jgi:hypothetical protein